MKFDLKHYGDEDGLGPEQLLFAEIMSEPGRRGMSLDDIAAHVGVSVRTISRWKASPAVMAYIRQRSLENVTAAMPDIMETLIEKARRGDSIKSIEIYSRIAGLMTPEIIVKAEQTRQQTNEEIEQNISELQRQLKQIEESGNAYETVEPKEEV